MRRFSVHVALMFMLLPAVAPVARATTYTGTLLFNLPAKVQKTEVVCTTCASADQGKPSVGYQGAIASFTGRFLDSSYDNAGYSLPRALRTYHMKFNAAKDRLYFREGSYLVGYTVSSMISRVAAGESLITIERPSDSPAGSYLKWDKQVNTEDTWPGGRSDGVDWLYDWDFDDRGNVYLSGGNLIAIVTDNYNRDGDFLPLWVTSVTQARTMVSVKTPDGHYYAVAGPDGQPPTVWDTTIATAPVAGITLSRPLVVSWVAKSTNDQYIAIINEYTKAVEIFTADGYVRNRAPIYTSPVGVWGGITTDGTNFYAAKSVGGTLAVSTFSPSGSTFTAQTITTNAVMNPGRVSYNAGYLAISGMVPVPGTNGLATDLRVLRVGNGTLTDLDLSAYLKNSTATPRYFAAYYSKTAVPAGYAAPGAANAQDALVYKANGRTYLIISALGLGDVYEIKGSDSIASINKGVTGTVNAHSTQTGSGPYYGDKVVFGSTTTAPAAMNVNWDFGNPEALDNSASSTTGADVVHQYSGLTATSQVSAPRTATVTNSVDSSIFDTATVTLAVPTPRVGISGQPSILFLQPNASSSAAIVTSDQWIDASDGTVEGHYSAWTIDGTTTKALPNATVPVGTCGSHLLVFTGFYGPYSGSGSSLISTNGALQQSIAGVNYLSRPFVSIVNAPSSDATNVTFTSGSRATTDTSVLPGGATFTWRWDLLNSSNTPLQTASGTSTLAQVPSFIVPRTSFTGVTGAKVSLQLSTSALSTACANYNSSTGTTGALSAPDPVVHVVSGCQYAGAACSLNVTSASGADTSGWNVTWSFSPQGPAGGGGISFSPSFSTTYSGTVTAMATNAIGSGSASTALTIATPICSNPPTQGDIAIQASASGNCTIGGTCAPNQSLLFGATTVKYDWSTCDQYLWTFGDGSTATTRSVRHAYTNTGTYHGSFQLTVGSTILTYPFTITVSNGGSTGGGGGGGGGGCPQITDASVFVTFSASSGCSYATSTPCATGEAVAFDARPYLGYNFACGTHTFSWQFGDGGSSSGQQVSHAYASSGTFTASVSVNSPTGTQSYSVPVTVGGGPSCGVPSSSNMTISLSGSTSGCSASNANCRPNESISMNVAALSGYSFGACTHTFTWNFGDGQQGSGQQVSHSYANAQSYAVQVTVTNSAGSVTLQKNIAITNPTVGCPVPSSANLFLSYLGGGCSSASPSVACSQNESLAFAVNPNGGYAFTCGTHTYSWTFDDGGSSPSRTPTHSFSAKKTYNVMCTITNPSGSTTLSIPVPVGTTGPGDTPGAVVDFAYAPFSAATPTLIQFTPSVTPPNSASSWKWSWGDNSSDVSLTGTSATPQLHLYNATGTYTVTLTTNVGVVTKQVVVGGSTTPRTRPGRH